jgi:hypothetical protein
VAATTYSVSNTTISADPTMCTDQNDTRNITDQAYSVINDTSQTACCYTCNRQFFSEEHLHRHEEQSELHRQNIIKIKEGS